MREATINEALAARGLTRRPRAFGANDAIREVVDAEGRVVFTGDVHGIASWLRDCELDETRAEVALLRARVAELEALLAMERGALEAIGPWPTSDALDEARAVARDAALKEAAALCEACACAEGIRALRATAADMDARADAQEAGR
jgi:predicted aminopeptidase